MATNNLINLNVDTLFEQHSVPEIDIVQKKIQSVVEKKREELRTMVGERYRDLLKAADTIAAMKESSSTLIAQVECITANCKSLNEQQLIGFKLDESAQQQQQRTVSKHVNNFFATMIQIKLLTSLPELIWMHIDREHFLTATELFIFSRHISTGLQLDAGNELMQKLPVAKKQWEVLKPFHVTLKQSMLAVLEREELTAEVAVNCLLGLFLLEKSNLNGVFKQFLQLRCAAFASCLNDCDASKGLERRRIKDCILASLKVLNSTMELIWRCFIGDKLLFQKLADHTNAKVLPTISLMDRNDSQFAHLLPDIIANFRPTFEAQELDEGQLRAALDQWLIEIRRIASKQLKELFSQVLTMETIQEIKTEANDCHKHHNFAPIVERFHLDHNLNFYEVKYVPLINRRVHDIIEKRWQDTMQMSLNQLKSSLQNVSEPGKPSIWLENSSDLPVSLAAALSDDLKSKKLLMKTKGYDDQLMSLCNNFDRELASIVSEVDILLKEQTTKAEDKLALIEFLRDTTERQINEFLTALKGLNLKPNQRRELLFVLRTCTALVELSPHLKICFCQQASWRQWVGNLAGNCLENWNRIRELLAEEVYNFWQLIVDGILEDFKCSEKLSTELNHEMILQDFAQWENINVEQKDEQDNIINTTFRIPSQPRISLQSYLFQLIGQLNKEIPETLPLKIRKIFNHKLLTQLLSYYRQLSLPENGQSNQTIALQLYFDLKFLYGIFGISREERQLNDEFHALQDILKDNIDPFDFELFIDHITDNVKRSIARLCCLFGVLVPPTVLNSSTYAASTLSLSQEMDPNVLTLSSSSSTSIWFSALPIITVDNQGPAHAAAVAAVEPKKADAEKTSPSKKSGSSTRRAEQKSKSFFGAMSQEWFR